MDATYLPAGGSAWRLALGNLDGSDRLALVCGTYQGTVGALAADGGGPLWRVDVGAFPFAVACGDVDGDGRDEVAAACADGRLHLLDGDGASRWSFQAGAALYGAAVGTLERGAPARIVAGGLDRTLYALDAAGRVLGTHRVAQLVNRIVLADVDGDGVAEIVLLDGRNTLEALKLAGDRLTSLWRRALTVPERMRNWENPGGLFHAFSLDALPAEEAGGPATLLLGDTYFNRQNVLALAPDGDTRWITEPLPRRQDVERWYEFYSACFVRGGTGVEGVRGAPAGVRGAFVAAVAGGLVRLFTADGEPIGEAESRIGFADLVLDGTTLYLGSTPNGDDTVYRVDLTGDWVAAIEGLERRGRACEVGHNLEALRTRALAHAGTPAAVDRTPAHDVSLLPGWSTPFRSGAAAGEALDLFRRAFPYDHLRFVAMDRAMEPEPPLNSSGEPWNPQRWETDVFSGTETVQGIVAKVRSAEAAGVPTVYAIGHSNMPFVTRETAGQMLDAGPTTVAGFLSAEDEDPARVNRYVDEVLAPLASRCAVHAQRHPGSRPAVILKNKGTWWLSQPATQPALRSLLLGEGRRAVVAATEDSNSRTPELNLLARVGLRQAGLIDRFMVGIHQDLFSFNRFHQWEYPKSGSPFLRLLVAHTVLGGSWTSIRAYVTQIVETEAGRALAFSTVGRESVEPFLHLVGKGLVFTPRTEQMIGLSRAGLAVHPLPERWLLDAHNGHRPWLWDERLRGDGTLEQAVLPHNGSTWGLTPTPPHALQAVLLNKRRQFGTFVPATPYGPFAIVPAWADLARVTGVDEWWHTDGLSAWRADEPERRLNGPAAAEAVRATFARAATGLPYRATGDDVFLHALRADDHTDRIYLIDPGWLDPQARRVTLHLQRPGVAAVEDLLSGESLPVSDGTVEVTVPAGALRILSARGRH